MREIVATIALVAVQILPVAATIAPVAAQIAVIATLRFAIVAEIVAIVARLAVASVGAVAAKLASVGAPVAVVGADVAFVAADVATVAAEIAAVGANVARIAAHVAGSLRGAAVCALAIVEAPAESVTAMPSAISLLRSIVKSSRDRWARDRSIAPFVEVDESTDGVAVKDIALPSVSRKRWYRSAPGWTDAIPVGRSTLPTKGLRHNSRAQ